MTNQENEKNLTVFGSTTEFEGFLEFSDNLIIRGKFNGEIKATGHLEIDKTAICDIDSIKAQSIIISGVVTGNIDAENSLEMKLGSKIIGDISTTKLRIEDGVDFDGEVTMLTEDPNVNIFSYSNTELRDLLLEKGLSALKKGE
ncbi:MAG: bactofilin family protein [Treponemataceae bacterium]